MDAQKIEKLKALGDVSISAREIAEIHEQLASSKKLCTTICAWIIKKAAAKGTCAAGLEALGGIFALADTLFFEADEILIPLEAIVMTEWRITCGEIGVKILGEQADKWAAKWCAMI